MWIPLACLSALFAGLTAITAKLGINKTDSTVATALRTIVVLIFSWLMALLQGEFSDLYNLNTRNFFTLILSGLATGASWLCYFKALKIGDVNKVVPIDKSSTILTVVLSILFLHESAQPLKLIGMALLLIGTLMMIDRKSGAQRAQGNASIFYALASAVFAALTTLLAKAGMDEINSSLATALRTGVVLVMAFMMVFIKGKQRQIKRIDRKELRFILLSGLLTGASWLCYFAALKSGPASVVVPIDKMSILVTVCFSAFILKERISVRAWLGLAVLSAGTLMMVFA